MQISDTFEVHNDDKDKGYISGDVKYDVSNNKFEYYWSNNYPTDSGITISSKPLIIVFSLLFTGCGK